MELAYLDQNIIGDIADRRIELSSNFQGIISETNFDEIQEQDAHRFLDPLERANVKLLVIEQNQDGTYPEQAKICGGVPLIELYNLYVKAQHNRPNAAIVAKIDEILVRMISPPNDRDPTVAESFLDVARHFEGTEKYHLFDELKPMILEADLSKSRGILGPVESTRKSIGTDQGKLNSISGQNIIEKILMYASRNSKYDFDVFMKMKTSLDSKYSKIVMLNSLLNLLGYNPDTKLANLSKTPNIRNDGEHIANAMFCNYLLTQDRRMANRASAIYDFLDLKTQVIFVD